MVLAERADAPVEPSQRVKELAGVVLFSLALLSKESAIFLLPLFVLVGRPHPPLETPLPRLVPAWFW